MPKFSSMKKRFSLRAGSGSRQNVDDISISDSLCSGVLRDAAVAANMDIGASNRSTPLIPGGVADFNAQLNSMNDTNTNQREPIKKPTLKRVETTESTHSNLTSSFNNLQSLVSDSSFTTATERDSSSFAGAADDHHRREQRKERVKEKLDRYKRDQKQLKKSCVALEQQLAHTTKKLQDVDTNAAFKIDSLESELRETRMGMEHVAKASTKEVTGQSECIKTLGKKLIRQAHVIKRQKGAVEQYKMQMAAAQEEMAMQDERDSHREDDMKVLGDELDCTKEQKVELQKLLQENIEEMMALKAEAEKDAKNIMELKFNMRQKEAALERVTKESSVKSARVSELVEELKEKDQGMESVKAELQETESCLQVMQNELKTASSEIEELRCQSASWKTGRGDTRPSFVSQASGNSILGWNRSPSSLSISKGRRGSLMEGGDDEALAETYELELQAKDATIDTLDEAVTEHEETIKTLQSDLVKMKSHYASDQYTKRKEIVQLKQLNAKNALKLRSLEKALSCVKSSEDMPMAKDKYINRTMHGNGGSSSSAMIGSSVHGLSHHGVSMHSASSHTTKEEKAAAVKARLGLAPYVFPVNQDSLVVQEANFFDGDKLSDQGSDLGGKGENPEEC